MQFNSKLKVCTNITMNYELNKRRISERYEAYAFFILDLDSQSFKIILKTPLGVTFIEYQ